MTVLKVTAIESFIGLSTDSKPASAKNGSRFYETDSGTTYMFNGTSWVAMADATGLYHVRKTITFTGAAGAGAVGTVTVFTITGRVWVQSLSAFCTTDLTEAGATATIECGHAGDTDAFIAQTTATAIDTNEWWNGTTPASGGYTQPDSLTAGYQTTARNKLLSANVILTIGTQNVTAGVIIFDAWYKPITDDGSLA